MSKNDERRSAKFRNSPKPRADSNKSTRIPKTPQIRNNLQNRSKLDIKITKVSKPTSEYNQRTQRPLFRTGTGSLFATKDNNHRDSETRVFSNAANSIADKHEDKGMHFNRSPNIFPSNFKTISNPKPTHSTQNSPDSSSTFFEPDSTIDDDSLETNLILDSNEITNSSILTKNTKLNIPIYHKPSSKHKAGSETPRKNISVKKLTQCKASSAKVKTPVISKIAITKTKPSNEKKDLQVYEFDTALDVYSSLHLNATKKNTPVYKKAKPTDKKFILTKDSDLDKTSQRRLQTPVHCSPVISGLSNSKSKPKNSPAIRKIPPTPRKNSEPKFPSPELFVDDYDSNQLTSSADLVLPSSDDLIESERISVFRNRLKTAQQVINSSICTQSSDHLENTSRYPLRNKTKFNPVTYDLPCIRRQRSNSQSIQSKFSDMSIKTRAESKSKAAIEIPTTAESDMNGSLQFSQFSSVHGSLLNFSTPQDLSTDIYDFASTLAPTRRRSQTNKKKTSAQQKVRNESISKVATGIPTTAEPFANASLEFSQFSSVPESSLDPETPQGIPKDVYDFVSISSPTKHRPQAKKNRITAQQKPRASKSTPVKKPSQSKSTGNLFFSAAFDDPLKNVSSAKKNTTPKSKPISNPAALSEITNQVPKKDQANVSKQGKNKAGNFLNSTFSQRCQTPSLQKSIFTTPGSQTSENFLNSNTPINSFSTFYSRASTPSQTYGNILAHIDRINHNNNDVGMQELCALFEMLKVSDISNYDRPSFLKYRDPCRVEKSYVKKNDIRCEKPCKIPFQGNTFMNYRMFSDFIVEENDPPFSRAPVKNGTSSEINYRPFKYAGDTPVASNDATDDTNLSVRTALRKVKYISRKVPHYFYADGDYNMDGFSDWD